MKFLLLLFIFIFCLALSYSASSYFNESSRSSEDKVADADVEVEDLQIDLKPSASVSKFKASLYDLCEPLLGYIGEYLDNPVATLGSLNHSFRRIFKGDYSLKYYVKKCFNIPEITNVLHNEPELSGILNLYRRQYDQYLIFLYLMEEIAHEKRPYKVIFRHLISYLARIFKELKDNEREKYQLYLDNNNISCSDVLLSDICAKNGQYDMAFEFLKNNPRSVSFCFSKVENREDLFNFFKLNPHFGIKYIRSLIDYDIFSIYNNEVHYIKVAYKWIGECIIHDAPEEFYKELLDLRPLLLNNLIESDWFLSSEVPQADHPRINTQIKRLANFYLESRIGSGDFNFVNLINDIRFGAVEDSEVLNSLHFEEVRFVIISKAALFGNKMVLFHEIYKNYNYIESLHNPMSVIVKEIVKMLYLEDINYHKSKLRVIFEFIASHTEPFATYWYLYFIMRFYAINHMKFDENKRRVILEFVALDDLLSLGFPPIISIKIEDEHVWNWFIDTIFSHMKVVSEETVISFLSDYKTSELFKSKNAGSFELIELVSKSSKLFEIIKSVGMKFLFNPKSENFIKYLDLTNFEDLTGIIERFNILPRELIKLKGREHFRKVEMVQKITVAEYFLEHESRMKNNGRELNEINYFDWRLAFDYWIKVKGDQMERIKEIQSPLIIEMLKLDFPNEMRRILFE